MLALHPAFQPLTYSQLEIETIDSDTLALSLGNGPAMLESDRYGWLKLLSAGRDAGLLSLLQGVDPTAQCQRDNSQPARWVVTTGHAIDANAEPDFAVQIAASAIAAGFGFDDQPDLLRIVE